MGFKHLVYEVFSRLLGVFFFAGCAGVEQLACEWRVTGSSPDAGHVIELKMTAHWNKSSKANWP
jgi:hypothetical protein